MAAAGSGERLGAGGPKAFVPVGGRPMIEWSLDAFRACESVDAIVVAAPPGREEAVGDGAPGPELSVVSGGATRAESVANALEAVDTELVAIHDAARPLLTPLLVEKLVACLGVEPGVAGVIAAAPVADTLKRVAEQGAAATRVTFSVPGTENITRVVESTLDRARLWAAQTPQVFRTEALRGALEVDEKVRDAATDEAMLVEAAGGTVLIHPAPAENLKVTTPLDLRVAELLLSQRTAAGPRSELNP